MDKQNLKEDVLKWIVRWADSPESVARTLGNLSASNFFSNTKNDYFALLILTVSAAKAYGVDKNELKLAIGQLLKII